MMVVVMMVMMVTRGSGRSSESFRGNARMQVGGSVLMLVDIGIIFWFVPMVMMMMGVVMMMHMPTPPGTTTTG